MTGNYSVGVNNSNGVNQTKDSGSSSVFNNSNTQNLSNTSIFDVKNADEAKRKQQEEEKLKKLEEEKKKAEEQKKVEEKKKAEEQKKLEEQKKAEEAKKEEETKKAEEQKKAETLNNKKQNPGTQKKADNVNYTNNELAREKVKKEYAKEEAKAKKEKQEAEAKLAKEKSDNVNYTKSEWNREKVKKEYAKEKAEEDKKSEENSFLFKAKTTASDITDKADKGARAVAKKLSERPENPILAGLCDGAGKIDRALGINPDGYQNIASKYGNNQEITSEDAKAAGKTTIQTVVAGTTITSGYGLVRGFAAKTGGEAIVANEGAIEGATSKGTEIAKTVYNKAKNYVKAQAVKNGTNDVKNVVGNESKSNSLDRATEAFKNQYKQTSKEQLEKVSENYAAKEVFTSAGGKVFSSKGDFIDRAKEAARNRLSNKSTFEDRQILQRVDELIKQGKIPSNWRSY